jgi:hypothetical protein
MLRTTSEVDLATELGIDLHDLWDERFSGKKHLELMELHEQRVNNWNTLQAMRRFEGTLNEYGQVYRERERLRRERISATKRGENYGFSKLMIEIAIRSLEANNTKV